MRPAAIVLLEFSPDRDGLSKGKKLRDGLSVALQIGNDIWVANDESISLERLTLTTECDAAINGHALQHMQFLLNDYLQLPVPPSADPDDNQEIDIEGLAYADDYLWLVGSHSLKRKKPSFTDGAKQSQKQLAKISSEGNRFMLARIPVVSAEPSFGLAKKTKQNGKIRTAAQLAGHDHGNDLTDVLQNDAHLAPFLAIPGKDNGFDIEGLAVVGKRLFLGLRGPVLRGFAVILELALEEDSEDPSTLRLTQIGPDDRSYRKHFLDLGGLGIRDLCVQDSDLLILAGPTMDLDGPVTVFRWPGGAKPKHESMVPANEVESVLDVPYGQGADHAEGICLYTPVDGKIPSLLVVYDSASVNRQIGESALVADVFTLPKCAKLSGQQG